MRRIAILLAAALVLSGFSGCPSMDNRVGKSESAKGSNQDQAAGSSKDSNTSRYGQRNSTEDSDIEGKSKDSPQSDQDRGTQNAEADIKGGKLIIRTLPLPSPPWANRHFQLLKKNGITLKSTKSPQEFKTDYIQAYNKRMQAEIDKKYGKGFIEKLEAEARRKTDKK